MLTRLTFTLKVVPVSSGGVGCCGSCAEPKRESSRTRLTSPRRKRILRERFAVGPNRSIDKIFLLPDRDSLLERIDDPPTCLEGRRAMRGIDSDQHARVADLQTAESMHQRDVADGELLLCFRNQFAHLLERHLLI